MALLEDTLILFCSDNRASGEVVREVDVSARIGGPERWASLKTNTAGCERVSFQAAEMNYHSYFFGF